MRIGDKNEDLLCFFENGNMYIYVKGRRISSVTSELCQIVIYIVVN